MRSGRDVNSERGFWSDPDAACGPIGDSDALFVSAHSVSEEQAHRDPEARIRGMFFKDLRYTLAGCRFMHSLLCMIRESDGLRDRLLIERWLNNWISDYVCADPNASETLKAAKPLGSAEVKVDEMPSNPRWYVLTMGISFLYQMECSATLFFQGAFKL